MYLESIVKFALGSARILPAVELLRDFSESAEREAKEAAVALFFLGVCVGAGSLCLVGAAALAGLGHGWFALASLALALPAGVGAHFCKARLDITRERLEQLKGPALAARAARAAVAKASEFGDATGRAASEAASYPGQAARAAGHKAGVWAGMAAASASALADPATRKAAADLASEGAHAIARGAGAALGWIKAKGSSGAAPSDAPGLPAPLPGDEQTGAKPGSSEQNAK